MYEYVFTDTEKKIDTSEFCSELSEIKTECLKQTEELIHARFTYPNGFSFESETYTDKIIIRSNRELVDNGDGTLSVLDK